MMLEASILRGIGCGVTGWNILLDRLRCRVCKGAERALPTRL
jgi:hypothetical protein